MHEFRVVGGGGEVVYALWMGGWWYARAEGGWTQGIRLSTDPKLPPRLGLQGCFPSSFGGIWV